MEHLVDLRLNRSAVRPSQLAGLDREQDAQLWVHGQVHGGRGRELANGGEAGLSASLAPLVDGDRREDARHEGGHRDGCDDPTEAADRPLLQRSLAPAGPPRPLAPGPCARRSPAGTPPRVWTARPWWSRPRMRRARGGRPRRRKLSSLAAASQSAAADASVFRTRMSSLASSIHPRSRSHAPRSASWATSTVGSGRRVAIEREETVTSVGVEGRLHRGRVGLRPGQLGEPHAAAGVRCSLAERHEAQEELANGVAAAELSRLEQVLGAGGEGAADSADLAVRVEREASLLPPIEQLRERVLHERQGPGLFGDVRGDLGDERRLHGLADRARRPDDRPLELIGRERVTTSVLRPRSSPNRG